MNKGFADATMDAEFAAMVKEEEAAGRLRMPKEVGNTPTDRVLDAVQNVKKLLPSTDPEHAKKASDDLRERAKALEAETIKMINDTHAIADSLERYYEDAKTRLIQQHNRISKFNHFVTDAWDKEIAEKVSSPPDKPKTDLT